MSSYYTHGVVHPGRVRAWDSLDAVYEGRAPALDIRLNDVLGIEDHGFHLRLKLKGGGSVAVTCADSQQGQPRKVALRTALWSALRAASSGGAAAPAAQPEAARPPRRRKR